MHLDEYKIPMTEALIIDVVGGLAIMGAQLVLHYWYGKSKPSGNAQSRIKYRCSGSFYYPCSF